MKVKSESEVAQSCLTLSDPMDCGPPGSSIHGIFQAGELEWGAIAICISKAGFDVDFFFFSNLEGKRNKNLKISTFYLENQKNTLNQLSVGLNLRIMNLSLIINNLAIYMYIYMCVCVYIYMFYMIW